MLLRERCLISHGKTTSGYGSGSYANRTILYVGGYVREDARVVRRGENVVRYVQVEPNQRRQPSRRYGSGDLISTT